MQVATQAALRSRSSIGPRITSWTGLHSTCLSFNSSLPSFTRSNHSWIVALVYIHKFRFRCHNLFRNEQSRLPEETESRCRRWRPGELHNLFKVCRRYCDVANYFLYSLNSSRDFCIPITSGRCENYLFIEWPCVYVGHCYLEVTDSMEWK